MFSQKRKNHLWIWVILLTIIVLVGIFVIVTAVFDNNTGDVKQSGEDTNQTVIEQPVDKEKKNENGGTENNEFFQSYYLIKYDNNNIKVFFSDETGKITELETTSIVFETLSHEDQSRFLSGIKINDRDELNRILMDYES